MLLVSNTGRGGALASQAIDLPAADGAAMRVPLGDDADMADDAVMLEADDAVEYDAAEQLVSLSQLSLEDGAGDGNGTAVAGVTGEQQAEREPPVGDENGTQEQQHPPAAAADGVGTKADAQRPAELAPAATVVS